MKKAKVILVSGKVPMEDGTLVDIEFKVTDPDTISQLERGQVKDFSFFDNAFEARRVSEPNWEGGCLPGKECPDCVEQRKLFGYFQLGDGTWEKRS